jgi:hypothetical protein
VLSEILVIRGEKGRKMPPSGMTEEEDTISSSAVRFDVFTDPGEGCGDVLDVGRVLDFGCQAIIRNDATDPLLGKELAQLWVFILAAALP